MDAPEQSFKKVAVLGLGLIGGSFAYALHEKYPDIEITAYDPAPGARPEFIKSASNAAAAVEGAELIMFAASPAEFSTMAKEIAPCLKKGAVITDVGSVKSQAIKAIAPELPEHVCYIPGHPIAGKAESGLAAAEAGLFAGKKVILTPYQNEEHALQKIQHLWHALGADVEVMSPSEHDLLYAYVSHLPQNIAFAMAPLVTGPAFGDDEKYRRFMRLTRSDVQLWADISWANAANVERTINDFNGILHAVIAGVEPIKKQPNPLEFARIISRCLNEAVTSLQMESVNPLAYAGSGFRDMTAFLPAPGEKLFAGEAVTMCRAVWEEMEKIKHALRRIS